MWRAGVVPHARLIEPVRVREIRVFGLADIEIFGDRARFTWFAEKDGLPVPRLVIPVRALPEMISQAAIFVIEQAIDAPIGPMLWH